jgi:hypothetical protein
MFHSPAQDDVAGDFDDDCPVLRDSSGFDASESPVLSVQPFRAASESNSLVRCNAVQQGFLSRSAVETPGRNLDPCLVPPRESRTRKFK